MLDLFAELLLLILNLLSLSVHTIYLLVQFVNSLILQRIVAILRIQFLNQCLKLLLLRLDIDGVSLKIVMLLLLELVVEF